MLNTYDVPFVNLGRQYTSIREEILDVTDKVMSTGQMFKGEYTTLFSDAIAHRCGRKYCLLVGSGTAALEVSYRMFHNLGGRNVLIPAYSYLATLHSAINAGMQLNYMDVDMNGSMDLKHLEHKLPNLPDGAVISYVNMFGNMLDYNKIRMMTELFSGERRLRILEDAAQSFGSSRDGKPSGGMGDISVLSFDPAKNLPGTTTGGAILTDNPDWFTKLTPLLETATPHQNAAFVSTNSKMSELNCAHLLVRLGHFDAWQTRRTEIARYYLENIPQTDCIHLPVYESNVAPNWHKFVIRVDGQMDRNRMKSHMAMNGIEVKLHYAYLLTQGQSQHWQTPNAFHLRSTNLSLPIYPEMTDVEVEQVVDAIKRFRRAE